MTTATPEPPETTKEEDPKPTEIVELGEGKVWCPRCAIVGAGRPHEHGKRWMTTEEAERLAKLFKEMDDA